MNTKVKGGSKKQPYNVISIHNRNAIHAHIELMIGPMDIGFKQRVHNLSDKQYAKHMGTLGKYLPHQGEREMARRVARMS